MKFWIWIFVLVDAFLFSGQVHAYPEYAVRLNIIRCTACHISPVGGGPKTVNGKLFGAHGYKINPVLAQDYVGADFRALYYYPEHPSSTKGGDGVMSGSVSGHVALDEASRVHLVIEHNIAGFSAAPFRDTYALFKFHAESAKPHWLDSVLIGRFRLPFGIITDEHRTYTRVQTSTEWFTFQSGALLSGTPTDQLHYDLALLNGDQAAGSTLNEGQAERFGGSFNLRYMPGPVLLGFSTAYFNAKVAKDSRSLDSVYGILSIGRWTNDRVPLSLKLEFDRAKNSNAGLARGFASDPKFVTAVKSAQSHGWLARFDYALNSKWDLIYKYELLTPDRDFPADFYERHGLGFRVAIAPGTVIQTRTELARATHPSEKAKTGSAAQNASYAILQVAF